MDDVTVTHEWMNSRGGAENLLTRILACMGVESAGTAIAHPRWAKQRFSFDIQPGTSAVAASLSDYAVMFESIDDGIGLLARRVESPASQVTIRSHHHFSGFFQVNSPVEIAYIHAVPRLWWQPDAVPWERRLISNSLWLAGREADRIQAERATRLLCNSELTRARIQRYYARSDAVVVAPPVQAPSRRESRRSGRLVSVARLVEGKRFAAVLTAVKDSGVGWDVVGVGRLQRQLIGQVRGISQIRLVGDLSSTSVRRLVGTAAAMVNLGEEEFGIAVHEALLAHTPVIVAEDSFSARTVGELGCGYVVNPHSADEVRAAIEALPALRIDWRGVDECLGSYSMRRFSDTLQAVTLEAIADGVA